MSTRPTAVALFHRDRDGRETSSQILLRGIGTVRQTRAIASTMLKSMRVKHLIAASVAFSVSLLVGVPALADPADEVSAPAYDLAIPPQELGEALKKFSASVNEQVLFSREVVSGKRSREVKGQYSTNQALTMLLDGSRLSADRTPSGVLLIRSSTPTTPSSPRPAVARSNVVSDSLFASLAGQRRSSLSAQDDSRSTEQSGASFSGSPASQSDTIDEIIVSARKRDERLLDVPITMNVFSAQILEQLNANDFEDYAHFTPGLSFTKGRAGQTHVVIRGLSTGNVTNAQPQNRALVGIYLDDAPIQLTGFNFDPDLFDVERIEVLKGPQGTLFGDSAMAGAIRYVTYSPDVNSSEARVQLSTSTTDSGGDNYSVRAMANLPLSDRFALRASGYYRDESGWIDNLWYGVEDVNFSEIYGGRLSAMYHISEALSVRATVATQRGKSGGYPETDARMEGSAFQQLREIEPGYEDAILANLTISAELPFGTLTSVTGYLERDYEFYTGTNELSHLRIFGEYLPNSRTYYPWTQDYLTQEVRFSSSIGERFEYTLGAFYADQQINYPTYGDPAAYGDGLGIDQFLVNHGFASSVEEVQATWGCPPDQALFCGYLNTNQKQIAFFADTTIHFNSKWEMQLGARIADWKQDFDEVYAGFFNGGPTEKHHTVKEDSVNPRFSISYKVNEDANIFFSAGKGFRFGGVNDPLPPRCEDENLQVDSFESDSLWSYELGAKTRLLDRRLSLDGSVFYVVWDDIQTRRSLLCGFGIIANAGKMISQGLELGSTLALTDALQISLSGSFTNAELDEPSPNLNGVKGDRAPYIPKWKMSAFGTYFVPLGSTWTGFANAGVTAYGDSYTTFSSTTEGRLSRATIPSATIGTINLGAESDRLRFSIYAENLTNELVVYGATYIPAAGLAPETFRKVYGRPRTIGAEFEVRFQ